MPIPFDPRYRSPTLFDRIADGRQRLEQPQGLLSDDEKRAMRSEGLLGFGAAMLRASGPSQYPIGLGQALGEAIPAGQEAEWRGLETQDWLQQRRAAKQAAEAKQQALQAATSGEDVDFDEVVRGLLRSGDVETAGEIADIAKSLRLHFMKGDDGTIYALDPFTGEKRNAIGMEVGDEIVTLNPDQMAAVNTIRDDLIKEAGGLLDQASSYSRISGGAEDLKAAVQSGNRSDAAAAAASVINAYARLLDPGSIVREPEFRRVLSTGSLPARIESLLEMLFSGTMSVDVLNSIVRQSEIQMNKAREQYREVYVPSARDRIRDAGLPTRFLREPDPFRLFERSTTAEIPEPFIPSGTYDPSVVESMFDRVQRSGEEGAESLADLVEAEIRRRLEKGDLLDKYLPKGRR